MAVTWGRRSQYGCSMITAGVARIPLGMPVADADEGRASVLSATSLVWMAWRGCRWSSSPSWLKGRNRT